MSADWQTDVVVTVHDTKIELIVSGKLQSPDSQRRRARVRPGGFPSVLAGREAA